MTKEYLFIPTAELAAKPCTARTS